MAVHVCEIPECSHLASHFVPVKDNSLALTIYFIHSAIP